MRSLLTSLALCSLCLAALPALGQDRLEEELFEEEPAAEAAGEEEADEAAPVRGALDEALEEEPAADAPKAAGAAQADGPRPPVTRLVSAGVSAASGALAVSLVGAGVAFAHGGLWSLTGSDVGWLVGLGFAVLPMVGAAGGALFGAYPFVDGVGLASTAGVAAGAAGLGALLGFGIGAAVAGPQGGRKVPGENEWTAIALTATAVGAGVGAAIGAGATAPFFTTLE